MSAPDTSKQPNHNYAAYQRKLALLGNVFGEQAGYAHPNNIWKNHYIGYSSTWKVNNKARWTLQHVNAVAKVAKIIVNAGHKSPS
jgi:hypothetical protein